MKNHSVLTFSKVQACILWVLSAALCYGQDSVDFAHGVLPILTKHCAECHTDGTYEGGLSMDTRGMVIESKTVVVGKSDQSVLIERVTSTDPDVQMPPEGDRLTAAEIDTLRKWIDDGLEWETGFTFRQFPQAPLEPRTVTLPPPTESLKNPIDRLLSGYFSEHKVAPGPLVDDRTFARRVYLDLNGLLPPVDELEAFVADPSPDRRAALVDRLLARKTAYTEHWLTFWSDMLRSAYQGTGFIDGGRARIDNWLYASLYNNKPYDEFVYELVSGRGGSAGFINGIKWRGNVNESQRREMQAAQNVGQVFMGTNLKCASCHDSFVNQWKLADAYALASVFSDEPLELHRCDEPTGEVAGVGFIFPELGTIDGKADRATKMNELAKLIVKPENGRLARTMVNRLWAKLMGRGIVEPVDDMDQPPFSQDLLDWLAKDLADHQYDLKRTMRLICTSRVYQSQAVGAPGPDTTDFVLRGPLVKRMSAEMFADAVSTLTGDWSGEAVANLPAEIVPNETSIGVRAALQNDDTLTRVLGRPNREQVVTSRESIATTLQAIEMTNGATLNTKLLNGAKHWLAQSPSSPDALIDSVYLKAIGRRPTKEERVVARNLLGDATALPESPSQAAATPSADGGSAGAVPMWIWDASNADACQLQKEFAGGAKSAQLVATCDNSMTLYLNGKRVAKSSDWQVPVNIDISESLQPGVNQLRVEAADAGGVRGFALCLDLTMPDGSQRRIVSDESWQASTDKDEKTTAPVKVLGAMGVRPWGNVLGVASSRGENATTALSDQTEGLADLLWALTMLPEFQLIH